MKVPKLESYLSLIEMAQREDLGAGDVTSEATIEADRQGRGAIVFGEKGILCGMSVVEGVLRCYDKKLVLEEALGDGESVAGGTVVGVAVGGVRSILAAERVALNFLGRLSGIATSTAEYVAAVKGTGVKICDTRKTTPGWRELEKYAVRCGGGVNHRYGLYDAVLIKDNHLAALGKCDLRQGVAEAVRKIRAGQREAAFIEVEVDSLEQLRLVLQVEGVDMVLLDNMTERQLREAVAIRDEMGLGGKVLLEASGGVTMSNVRQIGRTGVDRISVGALTHTVRSLNVGLDLM
jgi:nicotinate-nucleotide pyrophosphorylase (carboxylating)